MKTCQKWVVVLTLCTPAGAWTGFSPVHVTLLHWLSRATSPCCLHTKPKRCTASPRFKASHPWLPLELPRQGLRRTKGRNHTVAIRRHHKEKPAHAERGAGGRGGGTQACRPGGGAGSSLVRAPVFLFSSHPHLASEAASRRPPATGLLGPRCVGATPGPASETPELLEGNSAKTLCSASDKSRLSNWHRLDLISCHLWTRLEVRLGLSKARLSNLQN